MFDIKITTYEGKSDLAEILSGMDEVTREWERRAARMECGWICADCCGVFNDGMPNECQHGIQWCTDIIARNKARENLQEEG